MRTLLYLLVLAAAVLTATLLYRKKSGSLNGDQEEIAAAVRGLRPFIAPGAVIGYATTLPRSELYLYFRHQLAPVHLLNQPATPADTMLYLYSADSSRGQGFDSVILHDTTTAHYYIVLVKNQRRS